MIITKSTGLNFTSLLWCLAFLIVFFMASEMVSGDSDLVLHIAYGNAIIDNGFPPNDPLLSGVTEAPILQEWLFEIVVAKLDSLFGLTGPLIVFAALMGSLVGGLYHRMRTKNICMWVAMLYGVIALLSLRPHLVIRPHLISWVAAALLFMLLEDWYEGRRSFKSTSIAVFAIMISWANLHGGFLLGLVIMAVFAVDAVVDKLKNKIEDKGTPKLLEASILLAVSAFITLLNPWGWDLHQHLVSFLTNSFIVSGTSDFQPPGFTEQTLPALLIVLCFVWPPLLVRFSHVRLTQWLLALGLSISACISVRNIPFLGILMLPIAATHLQQWLIASTNKISNVVLTSSKRMEDDEEGKTGSLWIVLSLILSSVLVGSGIMKVGLTGKTVPSAAIEWVEEQDNLHQLPVFADYLAAGYLLYATPVERVYLHALNANYPVDRLQTWVRVGNGEPGWKNDIQNLKWAFLLSGSLQADTLTQSSCWQVLYSDDMATIFQNDCTI